MYDQILVPTDGSDHAARATDHGAVIARAFDATLHLLTVVDVESAAGPFSAGGVDEEYVESRTEESQAELSRLVADVDGDLPVETAVRTGNPAETILDYVDDAGVDLVCMGTHGRRGLRRYLTGSVAERVVRQSPVPVLTVKAVADAPPVAAYDEVMVPTDGSDCAEAAVAHAVALAREFDARVHAVSVVDTTAVATGTEVGVPTTMLEQLEDAAAEAAESVERAAREAGLDSVTAVETGGLTGTLLDYADRHDVDLVCLGTHGRTGLDRVLVGSTAESLVRRSDAPVVTVSSGRL